MAAKDMVECGLMRGDDQLSRIIRRASLPPGEAPYTVCVIYHAYFTPWHRPGSGCADRHPVCHEWL